MLIDRTFGMRLHALYGNSELIIGLKPLRVIQGEAPAWVRDWAVDWARRHQRELLAEWAIDLNLGVPISRQASGHLSFA